MERVIIRIYSRSEVRLDVMTKYRNYSKMCIETTFNLVQRNNAA